MNKFAPQGREALGFPLPGLYKRIVIGVCTYSYGIRIQVYFLVRDNWALFTFSKQLQSNNTIGASANITFSKAWSDRQMVGDVSYVEPIKIVCLF